MTASDLPRLSTAQAAARLSVKPATLYAYVSRGLLTSRRTERGGSSFDPVEVEALASKAARRRLEAATAPNGVGRPLLVLDSPITLVEPDRLVFRGITAQDLADTHSFTEAVAHLWAVDAGSMQAMRADPSVTRALRQHGAIMPTARAVDRLHIAVLISAATDDRRERHDPASAHVAGTRMIGALIDGLPSRGRRSPKTASPAERLWTNLTSTEADVDDLALLDSALVLAMDHDLAASTMAARVAASARADPYGCVTAALGAFDGLVHGAVGEHAFALLEQTVSSGQPHRALAQHLSQAHGTPGFGHVIYREVDPRAEYLLERMRAVPRYATALQAADSLTQVVRSRLRRPANLDLALAVLALAAGFRAIDVNVIFAIARTAGWIAHIADEYTRPPLRLRPQSRYTGPPTPDQLA